MCGRENEIGQGVAAHSGVSQIFFVSGRDVSSRGMATAAGVGFAASMTAAAVTTTAVGFGFAGPVLPQQDDDGDHDTDANDDVLPHGIFLLR